MSENPESLSDFSLGLRNLVQYIGEICSVASLVILLQRALVLFTSAGSDTGGSYTAGNGICRNPGVVQGNT